MKNIIAHTELAPNQIMFIGLGFGRNPVRHRR
jgi:hypothetical protein